MCPRAILNKARRQTGGTRLDGRGPEQLTSPSVPHATVFENVTQNQITGPEHLAHQRRNCVFKESIRIGVVELRRGEV